MQALPLWGSARPRSATRRAPTRARPTRADAAWAELAARIKATYAEYYRAADDEQLSTEVRPWRLNRCRRPDMPVALPAVRRNRAQLEQTACAELSP